MAKIIPGDAVIIVLHSPREKVWGSLAEINSAGVTVRGIDLNSFDDFVRALQNQESFYGLNDQFFPMWRVERMTRDEPSGDIPSVAAQFEHRTGLRLEDV